MTRVRLSALTAKYPAGEWIRLRASGIHLDAVLPHKGIPSLQFFLHRLPCIFINDALMVILNVNLANLSPVFDRF